MRGWLKQARRDAGTEPGATTDELEELRRLRRENRELRRANEILKTASAFFCSRARPPLAEMIAYIDMYRDRFGVELICHTLAARECGFMTSRGYRAAKTRPACERQIRDRELTVVIKDLHARNYGVYGVRKMWHAMRRSGWKVGRDQVARPMRQAGISGVVRGRKPRTTVPGRTPDERPDLVMRDFKAPAPNRLWVADIERHEVLSNLAVVKGHRSMPVAAGV